MDASVLSRNLLMLRNGSGFSQEEIAARVGISRQAYAKWEAGTTVPDIEKCARLAEVYGVGLDSLIRDKTADGISVPPGPAGKEIWGSVTINDRGQLVIPKAARDLFGLTGGQRLIVLTEEGEGLALVPAEIFEKHMQEILDSARRDGTL